MEVQERASDLYFYEIWIICSASRQNFMCGNGFKICFDYDQF
jgi:hypothetical protein